MLRLAHFITRFPWPVLAFWLALTLVSLPFALRAPGALSANPGNLPNSEATRVANILQGDFGERGDSAVLLIAESPYKAGDLRFLRAYDAFVKELRASPGVLGVTRFDEPNVIRTASRDGRSTLTLAQISLTDNAALERIRDLAHAQEGALRVRVTGGQAIVRDFTEFAEQDTKRSEFAALPLTGLVLLAIFGTLVATGLPLLVGVLSITVALGGLYGLTQLTEVSTFAQSVITLVGLGAGIDYALLLVNRFREELDELAGGRPVRLPRSIRAEAARRAVLTAGRSVAFSGLTVALAMGALLAPPIAFVRSMGIGGVLVVLLTVAASLSALPALLTLLGERVNSPRLLRFTWSQSGAASAAWSAFARRVIARPWAAVLLASAALLLLALPARGMRLGYAGAYGLAPGVESRDALRAVEDLGAGGLLSAFEVVLDAPAGGYSPKTRERFRELTQNLEALSGVDAVISPFARPAGAVERATLSDALNLARRSLSPDRRFLRLTVLPDHNLRADEVDAFAARLHGALNASGFSYLLGGAPIGAREFTAAIAAATPGAVAAVLLATFALLAVAFRSLVIPLKSVAMNLLTVGAAYGIVTLVIQNGLFARWLGLPGEVSVLDSSLPLILFAVLFGLSMDYEIFLLSRVQEEHLAGRSNDEAIVRAVGRTGRVITSAAAIMFIVFCAFVSGRVVANKSIGVALAAAVVLDATLVRMVLVPGLLKLFGDWNWWLPAWLKRRLPRVRLEG